MDQRGDRVRIRLAGDFLPGQVVLEPAAAGGALPPQVQDQIAAAWNAALMRRGVRVFDGPMLGLRGYDLSDGVLRLRVSPTGYRHFLSTNLYNPDIADALGEGVLANAVGISVLLTGGRGRLVLGKRSDKVAHNPGRIHPIAGSLEPDDTDPFAAATRELAEEVGLQPGQVTDLRCVGMVEDPRIRQPELVFTGQTRVNEGVLTDHLNDEHTRLAWVEPDPASLVAAAANPQFTAVAAGALLLWGRRAHGEQWFADASQCVGARIDADASHRA